MSRAVSMSTDPAGTGPAPAAAPAAADTGARGRVAVIVPAAGKGERLGPGAPKALRELGGFPLLVHAVRTLVAARSVDVVVVAGGGSRQESVALALAALPADCDVVLVHDAARALTPVEVIEAVVAAVRGGAGAVIPVLPVTDTVKAVDGDLVTATVDRSTLRAVQTPQGFTRDILTKAHTASDPSLPATDDAGLVEALGLPVRTVPGHAEAFKITTPFDLVLAEAVLRRRR